MVLVWPESASISHTCMQQNISNFISRQSQCFKQKSPHHTPCEPLQTIFTSAPFEVISIDYVHLERSSSGSECILVVVVNFTQDAQAYVTRNKSDKTAANLFYNDFILRLGFHKKSTMTRVESLKTNSSIVLKNYSMSSTHEQYLTTHKVIGKPEDLTEPFYQCFAPYWKPASLIGETICQS